MGPTADQIELTVIGPGFGESILIHIGDGRWIIVDSCISYGTGAVAALDYLAGIGVNVATAVQLIVATHWHDDHIRGLYNILRACPSAEFCCSIALGEEEFIAQTKLYSTGWISAAGSGLQESERITSFLLDQAKSGAKPRLRRALANTRLFSRSDFSHGCEVEVTALSPSALEVQSFLEELRRLFPTGRQPKRRMPTLGPNNGSLVLWISIGPAIILLGADLEERGKAGYGWKAILEDTAAPTGKGQVFKIPHHGSASGHLHEIWTDKLERNPLSVLSPYNRGHKLPTRIDVDRILGYAPNSYSTSRFESARPHPRDRAVERQIREMGVKLHSVKLETGRVTIRNGGLSDFLSWHPTIIPPAQQLSGMEA
jgi:hypothetical protein